MTLAILATTYIPLGAKVRRDVVEASVHSWKAHIKVSDDLHLHVADDGSNPDLEDFWRGLVRGWASFSYSRRERSGLGASLNVGIAECVERSPFVLYPMDDWSLVADLDLDPWVKILAENEDVGCLRMGQPSGSVVGGRGRRFGLQVTISFDRYAFYWSLVPCLFHERFFDAYGPFREGVSAQVVENEYNQNIVGGNGPDVLVAMLTPWQHLWSVRLGDIKPGQAIPSQRLEAEVSTKGYTVI